MITGNDPPGFREFRPGEKVIGPAWGGRHGNWYRKVEDPEQSAAAGPTPKAAIANCLLHGRGMYPSPEEWADAVLKRLTYEGFTIVRRDDLDKLRHDLDAVVGYKLATAEETRGNKDRDDG